MRNQAVTKEAAQEENTWIADRLREYADLLGAQGEDGFRVRAYRNAAQEIERLSEPLDGIFASGGIDALIKLKGIGRGIAGAIAGMLVTGKWSQLERLKGEMPPEAVFATLPGIGPKLARRLVDELDVETLEELEAALRLEKAHVAGIGPRRRQALLAVLGDRLARLKRSETDRAPRVLPPVSLLLDADALYHAKAEAGELRLIAPRRFNPGKEAWLPVMHAKRDAWHLTVLFSNTALAHELGRTRDWVVIYFHEDDGPEGRCTVVTERKGAMAGKRVVRGREEECRLWYASVSA
jgi:hypothetical protein